ncbi:MAG: VIT1/CCC1 transporter family protein [Candidatus Micrarchaeales archaeon]|jgi:VIT1/CCC1 family predicted Fe2+/Mn2+ transporter
MTSRNEMEKTFLRDETLDSEIYSRMAKSEKNKKIKNLLERFAATERDHARTWRKLLKGEGVKKSLLGRFKMLEMLLARRLLGIAFVVKFLERHEENDLKRHRAALSEQSLARRDKKQIIKIIKDGVMYEKTLMKEADIYKGDLLYAQSIILGLNDGIVEILAIVAGIAMVAATNIVVVMVGLIAGMAGTLSMSAGVYLSSKSEGLIGMGGKRRAEMAKKEAYYAGMWYLIGAILTISPFISGFNGISGVLLSIFLISVAMTISSSVVAIMSGTSIRRRVFEMLAISLGVAFVTILSGIFAKLYFGVSI